MGDNRCFRFVLSLQPFSPIIIATYVVMLEVLSHMNKIFNGQLERKVILVIQVC